MNQQVIDNKCLQDHQACFSGYINDNEIVNCEHNRIENVESIRNYSTLKDGKRKLITYICSV